MTYIVVALKSEAQAFVEYFRLSKNRFQDYTIYKNMDISVLLSGVGVANMLKATNLLIPLLKDSDILLNIGICASRYKIGRVLEISKISYMNRVYELNGGNGLSITCQDFEATHNQDDTVDMESFGFYAASMGVKNRFMYKVVSDNFEPHKVSKDETKQLIKRVIDETRCC